MGNQSNCIAFRHTHIKMDMVPLSFFHEVMSQRCGRFAKPSGIDTGQTIPRNGSNTWKGHSLHLVTHGDRRLVTALTQSVSSFCFK